ncbi:hypothetical protein TNCT_687201 [Trichonephila clavata]|uniref:Uncharacterized protein n=1 Tax=Trichonephila clavata TaxID=2740835 RepID=A0A8X6IXB3_TRICU|nr:hypothetical protein TNCT_687201 [Trichonephila clavata]
MYWSKLRTLCSCLCGQTLKALLFFPSHERNNVPENELYSYHPVSSKVWLSFKRLQPQHGQKVQRIICLQIRMYNNSKLTQASVFIILFVSLWSKLSGGDSDLLDCLKFSPSKL